MVVNARNTAQRHKKDTEHIIVNKTEDTGMQSVFILGGNWTRAPAPFLWQAREGVGGLGQGAGLGTIV